MARGVPMIDIRRIPGWREPEPVRTPIWATRLAQAVLIFLIWTVWLALLLRIALS